MRRAAIVSLVAAVSLGACASIVKPNVKTEAEALRSGDYALDKGHASLIFKINHLGFSNFVGRFNVFDAALDFDEANPAAAKVDATIDMTSLDVADPEFAKTLTGPRWFDAAAFPQATFHSTAVAVTGPNTGRLIGDLTLHGVTKPVALDVVFNGGAHDILRGGKYVIGFSAHGTINRDDFGVSRFDSIVSKEVTIEVEAEFVRR
ncbi:MAG TPA: YceI family protein [Parvularculaceae bacterium]|nr:YceI family protein [Parvularculaceae bacterium]